MKLTKTKLKQIIQEELVIALKEESWLTVPDWVSAATKTIPRASKQPMMSLNKSIELLKKQDTKIANFYKLIKRLMEDKKALQKELNTLRAKC
tara:strand:- start:1567 stop:1845 length:279 start_codon:yes stop_codon:yes gene_type:complete